MFLPTQHELLLQIIERPEDDALRLVLADRLNDVGDPLGELIHVQLGIERILRGDAAGDWLALKRRELELVQRNGSTWQQQAAPFARNLTMKRGLPHTLHCSLNALLEDGGLTVLAPIRVLELERVEAEELQALLSLPLIRRLEALIISELRGLSRIYRAPPPLPPNIVRLGLAVDSDVGVDRVITFGFADHVQELELRARWLSANVPPLMHPPALPALKKLTFTRAYDRRFDHEWVRPLEELLMQRPGLTVVWRGLEYDATNIRSMLMPPERQFMEDPVARPPASNNRERFVPVGALSPIDTSPSDVKLSRSVDGTLVASSFGQADVPEELDPFGLDASLHLQLPPMSGVLGARSFGRQGSEMLLRYEPWAFRTLHEVKLPLPPAVALRVVHGLGGAMAELRHALRVLGVPGWPRALSRDAVLIGADGRVRLLPPFANSLLSVSRPLGLPLDEELAGSDEGMLQLLGTGLMYLLLGDKAVSKRLRPSGLNAEWKALDPVVDGCLSARRAALHASVDALREKLNASGLMSSQDAVAQHAWAEQSSPP